MAAVRGIIAVDGYSALSHRRVASEAGVDAATVYRRWPNRAQLAADLFLDLANDLVPIPDSGTLEGDLSAYLRSIIAFLTDKQIGSLTHAVLAASIDGDPDVAEAAAGAWQVRLGRAHTILENAVARGELTATTDRAAVFETLIAPAWFRLLVTKDKLDDAFIKACVRTAILVARN